MTRREMGKKKRDRINKRDEKKRDGKKERDGRTLHTAKHGNKNSPVLFPGVRLALLTSYVYF